MSARFGRGRHKADGSAAGSKGWHTPGPSHRLHVGSQLTVLRGWGHRRASRVYEMTQCGERPVVRIGTAVRIPRKRGWIGPTNTPSRPHDRERRVENGKARAVGRHNSKVVGRAMGGARAPRSSRWKDSASQLLRQDEGCLPIKIADAVRAFRQGTFIPSTTQTVESFSRSGWRTL